MLYGRTTFHDGSCEADLGRVITGSYGILSSVLQRPRD
jgi:hypothetical protein